tara:strand:+ start:1394 stop:1603 length:210 start_codon:yes stop_codon:yes gene_type:complete
MFLTTLIVVLIYLLILSHLKRNKLEKGMNIIKPIVSVLLMPLAVIVGVLVILAATQIAIHEALWKDKES